jgi:hypothetical protein
MQHRSGSTRCAGQRSLAVLPGMVMWLLVWLYIPRWLLLDECGAKATIWYLVRCLLLR